MKTYNKLYFLVALGITLVASKTIAVSLPFEIVNNAKQPIYYALGSYKYSTPRAQSHDEARRNKLETLYTKNESHPDRKNKYFTEGVFSDGEISQLLISTSTSLPTREKGIVAQLYEFDPRKLANKAIYVQIVDPLKPLEAQARSLFNPLGKSERGQSLNNNITKQELNNAYVGLVDYRGQ